MTVRVQRPIMAVASSDDSSSEEEELMVLLLVLRRRNRKKRQRSVWVRPTVAFNKKLTLRFLFYDHGTVPIRAVKW